MPSQPITIRYVGPSIEVYAVDLAAYVKRGETVDVADPDLAANLLAQEGTWAPAEPAKTAKPAAGAKED
jgi:hypothetical protein